MTFRPTDGDTVPDAELKALEEGAKLKEQEEKPKVETITDEHGEGDAPLKTDGEGEGGEKKTPPFHENPEVQLYIERQVQKRLNEGGSTKEVSDRLNKLEEMIKNGTPAEKKKFIPGLENLDEGQQKQVRSIIMATKREMLEDLRQADAQSKKEVSESDQALEGWMKELEVTGQVKTDKDKEEVIRLLAEYGKGRDDEEDKALILKLYNKLKEAKDKGSEEGEEEGIKKAQEAKIGGGRKGGFPGQKERTYQERMITEKSFDDIYERELRKLENRS